MNESIQAAADAESLAIREEMRDLADDIAREESGIVESGTEDEMRYAVVPCQMCAAQILDRETGRDIATFRTLSEAYAECDRLNGNMFYANAAAS